MDDIKRFLTDEGMKPLFSGAADGTEGAPLTAAQLAAALEGLWPVPKYEVRASEESLKILRRRLAGPPFDPTFAGIPVIVDPLVPRGMAALVGPPKEFDPAHPLESLFNVQILDFRAWDDAPD